VYLIKNTIQTVQVCYINLNMILKQMFSITNFLWYCIFQIGASYVKCINNNINNYYTSTPHFQISMFTRFIFRDNQKHRTRPDVIIYILCVYKRRRKRTVLFFIHNIIICNILNTYFFIYYSSCKPLWENICVPNNEILYTSYISHCSIIMI